MIIAIEAVYPITFRDSSMAWNCTCIMRQLCYFRALSYYYIPVQYSWSMYYVGSNSALSFVSLISYISLHYYMLYVRWFVRSVHTLVLVFLPCSALWTALLQLFLTSGCTFSFQECCVWLPLYEATTFSSDEICHLEVKKIAGRHDFTHAFLAPVYPSIQSGISKQVTWELGSMSFVAR